MITMLPDFPDDVAAIRVGGHVSRKDYATGFEPAVEAIVASGRKVRVYYELSADFVGFDLGAVWEDMTTGLKHFGSWKKVAIVTDVEWLQHATAAFRFMFPCPVKTFGLSEAEVAKAWVSA